jgi:hypothetical protein
MDRKCKAKAMADYITALSWEQSEEAVAKTCASEVAAAAADEMVEVEPSSSNELVAVSSEDTNDVNSSDEGRAKVEVVEGTIIAEAESEECAVCSELILPFSSSNTCAERSETECGGGHKHQFSPSVRLPQCGHCFHTQCVLKWLVEGNPTCPMCRAAVCPSNTDTTYDTRDLLTPPNTSQVEEGTHHQSPLSSLFSPTSNESRSRLPVAFRYVSVPRTPLRYVIDHPDMTSPPGSAAHQEELAIALLEMR